MTQQIIDASFEQSLVPDKFIGTADATSTWKGDISYADQSDYSKEQQYKYIGSTSFRGTPLSEIYDWKDYEKLNQLIKENFKASHQSQAIEDNLTGILNENDFRWFNRSEEQKRLWTNAEEAERELEEELVKKNADLTTISLDVKKIQGELNKLNTYFEETDINALIEEFTSDEYMAEEKQRIREIEKEIKQILNKEYSTELAKEKGNEKLLELYKEYDGINRDFFVAQQEIENKVAEFKINQQKFRALKNKNLQYVSLSNKILQDIFAADLEKNDIGAIIDAVQRNPGVVTNKFAKLINASWDLVTTIVGVGDIVYQGVEDAVDLMPEGAMKAISEAIVTYNPIGWVYGDFIDNSEDFENPIEYTKRKIADPNTSAEERIELKKNLQTLEEGSIKNKSVFSYYLADSKVFNPNKLQKPVVYEDINSLGDFVDWTTDLIATQIPNLALLTATGGQGNLGLILLGASSAGNKWNQMRSEEEQYYKTGGLYGQNHSYGSMMANALFTGVVEGASERVTLGSIQTTAGMLKNATKKQLKGSYFRYLSKEVFTPRRLAAAGWEWNNEGFSEVLATMGSNFADRVISGNKDINIYDNIEESYVSGAMISISISSPRLATQLYAPFKSETSRQTLDKIADQLHNLSGELDELSGNNTIGTTARRRKWQEINDQINELLEEQSSVIERDIKNVDDLHNSEKRKLIEIEKLNQKDKRLAEQIWNDDTTIEEKKIKFEGIQNRINERLEQKDKILKRVDPVVADKKYKNTVSTIKKYNDKLKKNGDVQINVIEEGDAGFVDLYSKYKNKEMSQTQIEDVVMENDGKINALNNIINEKGSTTQEINDAIKERDRLVSLNKNNIDALDVLDNMKMKKYGMMLPKFDAKGNVVSLDLVVNKDTAYEDGMWGTAAHEFLHGVFAMTMKSNPTAREGLSKPIMEIVTGKDIVWKEGMQDRFNKRIAKHKQNGEEVMAIFSEMMVNGEVEIKDGVVQKFKNFFRRFAQMIGRRDIKFDTKEDVKNFLRDFNKSFKKATANKAIVKMIEKGANGKIIESKSPEKAETDASFSEAVDMATKADPDLINEFDQHTQNIDGSRKYRDKKTFENSPDYYEAYKKIIDGKKLDGLIMQGMIAKGIPPGPAMKEFIRKVKENLAMRFVKNFDPAKNDSLAGWLWGSNGVIKWAKEDIQKEYIKEQQGQKTSLDKPIGEGGTALSDMMQADRDVLLDNLENQDLTPGRKQDAIDAIQALKVRELLVFPPKTIKSILKVVKDANLTIDGLTYKSIKSLIQKGSLSKILDTVSNEFGVEASRIRKNQDLNAKQRVAAQNYIYDKSTNTDGSFNDVFIKILPEGETRSGEATGVANTKLGQFYITGDRVKVSEGATKGLGQKKSQNKRTDITQEEFLGLFGINVDGTFQSGTSADGAIRALITQVAQLTANQEVRIDALSNGTTPIAIIAKLADGKSEVMFSDRITKEETNLTKKDLVTEKISKQWDNLITEIALELDPSEGGMGLSLDKATQIEGLIHLVQKIYNDGKDLKPRETNENQLTPKEVKALAEYLDGAITKYVKNTQYEFINEGFDEFMANEIAQDNDVSTDLDLRRIMNLKTTVSEGLFSTIDGIKKIRRVFKNTFNQMVKEDIKDNIDNLPGVIADIMSIGKESLTGSGKLGKFKKPKKGGAKPIELGGIGVVNGILGKDQRYKAFLSPADLMAMLNKLSSVPAELRPGKSINNDYIKYNKNKIEVYHKGEWVQINTTQLAENVNSGLQDKGDTKRSNKRTKEKIKNRRFAVRVLETVYKQVVNTESREDGKLIVAAVMTNLGSGMNSSLRKSAQPTAQMKNAKFIQKWMNDNLEAIKQITTIRNIVDLRYEHSKSKAELNRDIWKSLENNNGKISPEVFDGYEVFIISGLLDIAQDRAGYKIKSTPSGELRVLDHNTIRELVELVQELKDGGLNIPNSVLNKLLSPLERITSDRQIEQESREVMDNAIKILELDLVTKVRSDIINRSTRDISNNNAEQFSGRIETKGASVFDFDDTLASTKSGVRYTIPNEDGTPKPRKKVIFLAGGAGSGKGNVVNKLGLEGKGYKIVNQDISLEWLKKNHGLPENMNDLTKEQRSLLGKLGHQARGIAKRKMMKFQGQGDGVVVDGTGASLKNMKKLVEEFEAKGYDVSMVFVETSLDVALERNRARPERSLLDIIVKRNHESVMANKDAFKEMFGDTFMEVNTDNLTMDSPMPSELTNKMDDFTNSYEKGRLTAEQFAEQGADILAKGGKFDFSEFNDVVDGTPGPLLDKAKARAEKYGTDNIYVLTARPGESAKAIQEFLKSQGLDIPLKNITGLANSTGEAKGLWVLNKINEGFNDIYFVDDALANVPAVKYVIDQMGIKGKSVRTKLKKVGKVLIDTNTKAGQNVVNEIKKIEGITPNVFKKVGNWIVDTSTQAGKNLVKELNNAKEISPDQFGSVSGLILNINTTEGKQLQKSLENVKKSDDVQFSDRIETNNVIDEIVETKPIDQEFNEMIERTSGVEAKKRFSKAEGRVRGRQKGKWDYFIPPSAEDFKGLLYKFLGKGKQGEADLQFLEKVLLLPFAKAYRNWNIYKQKMSEEYQALRDKFPDVTKQLNTLVPDTNFTVDTAIRVYLWDKAGFKIPGMAETTKRKLIEHVTKAGNSDLVIFADTLSKITRRSKGYIEPGDNWNMTTIAGDLNGIVGKKGRQEFFAEWIENKNIIFSEANLNKIEAIHGPYFREALENMLHRMETGTNRLIGTKDGPVKKMLDWINGAVGATMFWNMRSALIQTISTVNFINWSDNNIFKAAKAFANQKQFWSDFIFIFNSPMLKQRRAGLQIDVSASELTNVFAENPRSPMAVLNYLLQKGFTPTRIADGFAIAFGGASMYRNRVDRYMSEGMSKAEAESKAFLDFQEVAEETQQSSRPDLISQQQAGTLGRIILAWQNTPMQMTRLMKKALSDIVNGRGDMRTNISKLIYYGFVQNVWFGTLQSGLAWLMFGGADADEEEMKKKELSVLNGALNTLLRGTGIYGAAVATLKDTILEWQKQRKQPYGRKRWDQVTMQMINLSPPIGSKIRKINNAIQTWEYNKGVSDKMPFRVDNPNYHGIASVIEGLTNIPIARTLNKMNNLEEAITGNHELWQRIALATGWNRWNIGVVDEELEAARAEVKEERKAEKEELKRKEKEKKKQEEIDRKKREGIKTVRCSGIRSNGERCALTTETKEKSWKCMHHMDFEDGMDLDGDGKKEYRCTGIKTNGERCKNRTENKNKKCYAHQ